MSLECCRTARQYADRVREFRNWRSAYASWAIIICFSASFVINLKRCLFL